ncbi:MAG: hypothetical protein ACTSXA_15170, partial [Candidatus Heimdallarchaeota archaeon]
TKIIGILTQEMFAGYPDNLPKKYQKQMFEETLYMRKKATKPETFSPYTKHTMQLFYLSMLNMNFIHKIGKKKHQAFLETNPLIKDVFNLDYIGEELPNPDMTYNEFNEFLQSKSEQVQRLRTKAAKKERLQQVWLFDNWLFYQEFAMVMSLLESFLRDSCEMYRCTYPNVNSKEINTNDLDNCCFPKLLKELMIEEYKLVQRVGHNNTNYLHDCWKIRNAIVHNGGVVNAKIIKQKKDFPYKIGDTVKIDAKGLDKLYGLSGKLQNIIYKRIRLGQKTKL